MLGEAPALDCAPRAQRRGACGHRAQREAAPIPGGKAKPGGPHLREVTPPSELHWSRGWAGRAHEAWRKRKGVRRSYCRRRCLPRSVWRKWRRRRRPRRTRSNLAVLAAAPWTWSGAASRTAWCGHPSRCSRESSLAFGRDGETWAGALSSGGPGPASPRPKAQQSLPEGPGFISTPPPACCQWCWRMGPAPLPPYTWSDLTDSC